MKNRKYAAPAVEGLNNNEAEGGSYCEGQCFCVIRIIILIPCHAYSRVQNHGSVTNLWQVRFDDSFR